MDTFEVVDLLVNSLKTGSHQNIGGNYGGKYAPNRLFYYYKHISNESPHQSILIYWNVTYAFAISIPALSKQCKHNTIWSATGIMWVMLHSLHLPMQQTLPKIEYKSHSPKMAVLMPFVWDARSHTTRAIRYNASRRFISGACCNISLFACIMYLFPCDVWKKLQQSLQTLCTYICIVF